MLAGEGTMGVVRGINFTSRSKAQFCRNLPAAKNLTLIPSEIRMGEIGRVLPMALAEPGARGPG